MTGAVAGVGIGARLRAARERRSLTVLQAAEKLHVDARMLEALEGEDFASLGADVYVRGHLRRYAELVGESGAELQELYANVQPAARPDLTRIPRQERTSESARLALPALVVAVCLAAAGLLWWLLTQPGAKPQPLPPPPPLTPQPLASASAAPAAAQSAPRAGAALPSAPTAPGAGETVTLHFSGDSWVQIADARGKVLLDGVQPPGSVRSVSGPPPLRIVLGNAPAVAVEVNGHPAKLEGLVRRRGDAHFLVSAGGTLSAPLPPAHGD